MEKEGEIRGSHRKTQIVEQHLNINKKKFNISPKNVLPTATIGSLELRTLFLTTIFRRVTFRKKIERHILFFGPDYCHAYLMHPILLTWPSLRCVTIK